MFPALLVISAASPTSAEAQDVSTLDTRSDLIGARGLCASLGFVEGPAHNADPYANHWFRKEWA